MAARLAERLSGDLDVVLVHKIGAPDNPEFAIGSVSEFGEVSRSPAISLYEIPSRSVEEEIHGELEKLRARRRSYSGIRPPFSPKDRTVIIVDDGVATGYTMLAAARAIRSQHPRRLILASPVASRSAVELLTGEADELVFLDTPEELYAISQFYEHFPQVSDEEVLRTLAEFRFSQGPMGQVA